MTPERYQQINQLLDAALERAPDERTTWLAAACGTDEELRREVESLLAACDEAGSFIAGPAAEAADLLADSTAELMTGRTLGRYRLGALLGAGGMGQVYRAHDLRLEREVAVKILPEHLAQDPEALRRFEREAKAVAALSHPNILSIFDFGTAEQVSYAVMELLEGETLRARLAGSVLPWRQAVEIAMAVAEGLAVAHAKGIIHRDLKPENIFLTKDGGVKILDFGIARVKRVVLPDTETLGATAPETTRPGVVIGTLGYMSPEQVRGEEADAPSDIFSLGCVLYEMLSGQRPFARATTAEVIAAILDAEPPALSTVDKQLPTELERALRHCLQKRAGGRYQTAHELATDLRAILSGSSQTLAAPALARRRLHPAVLVVAVLLLVLLGLGGWFYLNGREGLIDSLAVLPLVNASGNTEGEILSDGITESLIDSLSQLPNLRVTARSTVFTYKGKEIDPRQVGQELNVRAVFMGRVTQRADTLLIGTELVKAADGSRLWGEPYERKLADVIVVQTEIAKQISEKLRIAVTGEQQQRLTKHHTENTEAYKLYFAGRWHALNLYTADGFQKGIASLNQAIALDPAYALAHAGLAATYYDASGVWLQPKDAMLRAEAAALDALRLDESLAEAHTALAQIQALYKWNWVEAGQHYRRALELNPNLAQAHLSYGIYLAHQGQLAAGIEEMEQAQRLDPLTPATNMVLAVWYYAARRNEEAISICQKVIQMRPEFALIHSVLGLVYEQQARLPEAIEEFDKVRRLDPKNPFTLGFLGHAYAISGKRDEAQRMIAEMKRSSAEQTYVDPFAVALVYVGLGKKDETFAWLGKALQERSENLLHFKDTFIFDSLRADPRFKDLLRHMNLVP